MTHGSMNMQAKKTCAQSSYKLQFQHVYIRATNTWPRNMCGTNVNQFFFKCLILNTCSGVNREIFPIHHLHFLLSFFFLFYKGFTFTCFFISVLIIESSTAAGTHFSYTCQVGIRLAFTNCFTWVLILAWCPRSVAWTWVACVKIKILVKLIFRVSTDLQLVYLFLIFSAHY